MLILGPRAVQRLESFQPKRALPKIFRMTKGGKLIKGIFQGSPTNSRRPGRVQDTSMTRA